MENESTIQLESGFFFFGGRGGGGGGRIMYVNRYVAAKPSSVQPRRNPLPFWRSGIKRQVPLYFSNPVPEIRMLSYRLCSRHTHNFRPMKH